MAMADDGELTIIAPGLREFGEDAEIDRLIRKYGYRGTPATLNAVSENPELQANLSAAAHLIHGSTEGRFKVTYATEHLTQAEIESVGYQWAPVDEVIAKYNPAALADGFNDGSAARGRGGFQPHRSKRFFYISEPGQGLWALQSRFSD